MGSRLVPQKKNTTKWNMSGPVCLPKGKTPCFCQDWYCPHYARINCKETKPVLVRAWMPGLTPNKQIFMHIYSSWSLFFVFVPVIILFKSNMDAITIIMFYCSIPFQRYQTWYGNNYLNLISSHASPWENVVLVMLHRATSWCQPGAR